jgi:hypothetical protein
MHCRTAGGANRRQRTTGLTGYVAGTSREDDESDVLSYAVFLDNRRRVFRIEPGDP